MANRSEHTPFGRDDGISQLQEDVLGLLEAAGIPTATNDAIVKLIVEAERAMAPAELECRDHVWVGEICVRCGECQ